mgnify:CR=1 FL=1
MKKYIEENFIQKDVSKKIQNIIGKKPIHVGYTNGKLRVLEIDDTGLSASKKKELQEYVDTLQ